MKIQQIAVTKENLQLSRPYTIAFKTIDYVENGIIKITSTSGLTGYGAFNPSYEVVGEKLEDGLSALSNENLEWLIGRDIRKINQLCDEVQQKFSGSTSARIGLEIALYDLFSQMLNVPLVSFFGQKIKSMPTSITIGIKNVKDTIEEAKEYVGRRFRILKVKLGISFEEDLERLVKLRETFGNSIDIIIDANQGYDRYQLVQFFSQAAGLDIQLIEQPLEAGNEEIIRQLPENLRRLLAADESLITPGNALLLAADPKPYGFFNIKLMKCGGITEALKIANTGAYNNIGIMWGCNDESIISITAALHTAFACSNTKFIDLDGSLDLAKDVVAGGFILKDGIMSVSDKPGLGLTNLV